MFNFKFSRLVVVLAVSALVLQSAPGPCHAASLTRGTGGNTNNKLTQKLSKAHFEFSLNLYKDLVRSKTGDGPTNNNTSSSRSANLVYSPYSVNSVLSMIFLGTSSSSNSSLQLRALLRYDDISYVDVHNAFKEVVKTLDENYYEKKVRSANGLFVQKGVQVSGPYDRALREFYHAKIEEMDFRNSDPDQTMGVVNDWVKDVTDGQIPDLLSAPPGKDSKLLLVNALAMNAKWRFPFNPLETFDKGLFFLPNNER